MSKHVPGPWTEAGQAVYAQTPQKIDHLRVRGADEKETVNGEEVGYLVAESIWCADTRRLIAAAPDLLDACTQLIWAIDHSDDGEFANGYSSALAAITKAKAPP